MRWSCRSTRNGQSARSRRRRRGRPRRSAPRSMLASGPAVSGPVAMMTLPHSAGGAATSSRRTSISGSVRIAAVTPAAKALRSTASADPAGTRAASASRRISEPSDRISAWISPTALWSGSSERKLFEQTSSASASLWCASVRCGPRISWRTTGTPARAHCHAASDPARPPPMMCTGPLTAPDSGVSRACGTNHAAWYKIPEVDDVRGTPRSAPHPAGSFRGLVRLGGGRWRRSSCDASAVGWV